MTITEFNNKVVEIVGRFAGDVPASEILPESKFQLDLGMSSLSIMTMVAELEDEFDVRIPPRALNKIMTIGDLQEFILKKLL